MRPRRRRQQAPPIARAQASLRGREQLEHASAPRTRGPEHQPRDPHDQQPQTDPHPQRQADRHGPRRQRHDHHQQLITLVEQHPRRGPSARLSRARGRRRDPVELTDAQRRHRAEQHPEQEAAGDRRRGHVPEPHRPQLDPPLPQPQAHRREHGQHHHDPLAGAGPAKARHDRRPLDLPQQRRDQHDQADHLHAGPHAPAPVRGLHAARPYQKAALAPRTSNAAGDARSRARSSAALRTISGAP